MTGLIPLKPLKLETYAGLSLLQAAFLQLSASLSHAFSNVTDGDVFGSQGAGIKQMKYAE
jgi:hypothetical protein